jgi:signal transduction histidine kinase
MMTHWVQGDRLRLQQVLINLAGNALKFTESGSVVLSLTQRATTADHVVLRISVRDSGIGIHPEQLQAIFEGFSQGESSISRRFGGTGLGLAISQRLVALMGGELHVESTLGVGSCFWF